MTCKHENFTARVAVNRIQKSDVETGQVLDPDLIVAYTADIRVNCHECGQPFEFFGGFPVGMSFYRPTVSLDGQELHVPLAIPGTRPPDGMPGYAMTFSANEDAEEKEPTKQ